MPDQILGPMKEWKVNKYISFFSIIFIFLIQQNSIAQDSIPKTLSILFYNVENLFDTFDDSLKQDNEFLPESVRHWTNYRYNTKLTNISRVIYEANGWNPPCFVGLCEVENKKNLENLTNKSGLNNLGYKFIHYESKDIRGIDVALLYRDNIFSPIQSKPIPVDLGESRPTRDILYTYGLIAHLIPIHLFVCHFPSRYGGVMETEQKRHKAAETLVDAIHEITKKDPDAYIIVMGDFNDNPDDDCMNYIKHNTLVDNLAKNPTTINHSKGTLKYKTTWSTFDQLLISKSLQENYSQLQLNDKMHILDFDFLLEEDTKYTGKKPLRTYNGYKYHHGFSDHLPVEITLKVVRSLGR